MGNQHSSGDRHSSSSQRRTSEGGTSTDPVRRSGSHHPLPLSQQQHHSNQRQDRHDRGSPPTSAGAHAAPASTTATATHRRGGSVKDTTTSSKRSGRASASRARSPGQHTASSATRPSISRSQQQQQHFSETASGATAVTAAPPANLGSHAPSVSSFSAATAAAAAAANATGATLGGGGGGGVGGAATPATGSPTMSAQRQSAVMSSAPEHPAAGWRDGTAENDDVNDEGSLNVDRSAHSMSRAASSMRMPNATFMSADEAPSGLTSEAGTLSIPMGASAAVQHAFSALPTTPVATAPTAAAGAAVVSRSSTGAAARTPASLPAATSTPAASAGVVHAAGGGSVAPVVNSATLSTSQRVAGENEEQHANSSSSSVQGAPVVSAAPSSRRPPSPKQQQHRHSQPQPPPEEAPLPLIIRSSRQTSISAARIVSAGDAAETAKTRSQLSPSPEARPPTPSTTGKKKDQSSSGTGFFFGVGGGGSSASKSASKRAKSRKDKSGAQAEQMTDINTTTVAGAAAANDDEGADISGEAGGGDSTAAVAAPAPTHARGVMGGLFNPRSDKFIFRKASTAASASSPAHARSSAKNRKKSKESKSPSPIEPGNARSVNAEVRSSSSNNNKTTDSRQHHQSHPDKLTGTGVDADWPGENTKGDQNTAVRGSSAGPLGPASQGSASRSAAALAESADNADSKTVDGATAKTVMSASDSRPNVTSNDHVSTGATTVTTRVTSLPVELASSDAAARTNHQGRQGSHINQSTDPDDARKAALTSGGGPVVSLLLPAERSAAVRSVDTSPLLTGSARRRSSSLVRDSEDKKKKKTKARAATSAQLNGDAEEHKTVLVDGEKEEAGLKGGSEAGEEAEEEALTEHTPYDHAMDHLDASPSFLSEQAHEEDAAAEANLSPRDSDAEAAASEVDVRERQGEEDDADEQEGALDDMEDEESDDTGKTASTEEADPHSGDSSPRGENRPQAGKHNLNSNSMKDNNHANPPQHDLGSRSHSTTSTDTNSGPIYPPPPTASFAERMWGAKAAASAVLHHHATSALHTTLNSGEKNAERNEREGQGKRAAPAQGGAAAAQAPSTSDSSTGPNSSPMYSPRGLLSRSGRGGALSGATTVTDTTARISPRSPYTSPPPPITGGGLGNTNGTQSNNSNNNNASISMGNSAANSGGSGTASDGRLYSLTAAGAGNVPGSTDADGKTKGRRTVSQSAIIAAWNRMGARPGGLMAPPAAAMTASSKASVSGSASGSNRNSNSNNSAEESSAITTAATAAAAPSSEAVSAELPIAHPVKGTLQSTAATAAVTTTVSVVASPSVSPQHHEGQAPQRNGNTSDTQQLAVAQVDDAVSPATTTTTTASTKPAGAEVPHTHNVNAERNPPVLPVRRRSVLTRQRGHYNIISPPPPPTAERASAPTTTAINSTKPAIITTPDTDLALPLSPREDEDAVEHDHQSSTLIDSAAAPQNSDTFVATPLASTTATIVVAPGDTGLPLTGLPHPSAEPLTVARPPRGSVADAVAAGSSVDAPPHSVSEPVKALGSSAESDRKVGGNSEPVVSYLTTYALPTFFTNDEAVLGDRTESDAVVHATPKASTTQSTEKGERPEARAVARDVRPSPSSHSYPHLMSEAHREAFAATRDHAPLNPGALVPSVQVESDAAVTTTTATHSRALSDLGNFAESSGNSSTSATIRIQHTLEADPDEGEEESHFHSQQQQQQHSALLGASRSAEKQKLPSPTHDNVGEDDGGAEDMYQLHSDHEGSLASAVERGDRLQRGKEDSEEGHDDANEYNSFQHIAGLHIHPPAVTNGGAFTTTHTTRAASVTIAALTPHSLKARRSLSDMSPLADEEEAAGEAVPRHWYVAHVAANSQLAFGKETSASFGLVASNPSSPGSNERAEWLRAASPLHHHRHAPQKLLLELKEGDSANEGKDAKEQQAKEEERRSACTDVAAAAASSASPAASAPFVIEQSAETTPTAAAAAAAAASTAPSPVAPTDKNRSSGTNHLHSSSPSYPPHRLASPPTLVNGSRSGSIGSSGPVTGVSGGGGNGFVVRSSTTQPTRAQQQQLQQQHFPQQQPRSANSSARLMPYWRERLTPVPAQPLSPRSHSIPGQEDGRLSARQSPRHQHTNQLLLQSTGQTSNTTTTHNVMNASSGNNNSSSSGGVHVSTALVSGEESGVDATTTPAGSRRRRLSTASQGPPPLAQRPASPQQPLQRELSGSGVQWREVSLLTSAVGTPSMGPIGLSSREEDEEMELRRDTTHQHHQQRQQRHNFIRDVQDFERAEDEDQDEDEEDENEAAAEESDTAYAAYRSTEDVNDSLAAARWRAHQRSRRQRPQRGNTALTAHQQQQRHQQLQEQRIVEVLARERRPRRGSQERQRQHDPSRAHQRQTSGEQEGVAYRSWSSGPSPFAWGATSPRSWQQQQQQRQREQGQQQHRRLPTNAHARNNSEGEEEMNDDDEDEEAIFYADGPGYREHRTNGTISTSSAFATAAGAEKRVVSGPSRGFSNSLRGGHRQSYPHHHDISSYHGAPQLYTESPPQDNSLPCTPPEELSRHDDDAYEIDDDDDEIHQSTPVPLRFRSHHHQHGGKRRNNKNNRGPNAFLPSSASDQEIPHTRTYTTSFADNSNNANNNNYNNNSNTNKNSGANPSNRLPLTRYEPPMPSNRNTFTAFVPLADISSSHLLASATAIFQAGYQQGTSGESSSKPTSGAATNGSGEATTTTNTTVTTGHGFSTADTPATADTLLVTGYSLPGMHRPISGRSGHSAVFNDSTGNYHHHHNNSNNRNAGHSNSVGVAAAVSGTQLNSPLFSSVSTAPTNRISTGCSPVQGSLSMMAEFAAPNTSNNTNTGNFAAGSAGHVYSGVDSGSRASQHPHNTATFLQSCEEEESKQSIALRQPPSFVTGDRTSPRPALPQRRKSALAKTTTTTTTTPALASATASTLGVTAAVSAAPRSLLLSAPAVVPHANASAEVTHATPPPLLTTTTTTSSPHQGRQQQPHPYQEQPLLQSPRSVQSAPPAVVEVMSLAGFTQSLSPTEHDLSHARALALTPTVAANARHNSTASASSSPNLFHAFATTAYGARGSAAPLATPATTTPAVSAAATSPKSMLTSSGSAYTTFAAAERSRKSSGLQSGGEPGDLPSGGNLGAVFVELQDDSTPTPTTTAATTSATTPPRSSGRGTDSGTTSASEGGIRRHASARALRSSPPLHPTAAVAMVRTNSEPILTYQPHRGATALYPNQSQELPWWNRSRVARSEGSGLLGELRASSPLGNGGGHKTANGHSGESSRVVVTTAASSRSASNSPPGLQTTGVQENEAIDDERHDAQSDILTGNEQQRQKPGNTFADSGAATLTAADAESQYVIAPNTEPEAYFLVHDEKSIEDSSVDHAHHHLYQHHHHYPNQQQSSPYYPFDRHASRENYPFYGEESDEEHHESEEDRRDLYLHQHRPQDNKHSYRSGSKGEEVGGDDHDNPLHFKFVQSFDFDEEGLDAEDPQLSSLRHRDSFDGTEEKADRVCRGGGASSVGGDGGAAPTAPGCRRETNVQTATWHPCSPLSSSFSHDTKPESTHVGLPASASTDSAAAAATTTAAGDETAAVTGHLAAVTRKASAVSVDGSRGHQKTATKIDATSQSNSATAFTVVVPATTSFLAEVHDDDLNEGRTRYRFSEDDDDARVVSVDADDQEGDDGYAKDAAAAHVLGMERARREQSTTRSHSSSSAAAAAAALEATRATLIEAEAYTRACVMESFADAVETWTAVWAALQLAASIASPMPLSGTLAPLQPTAVAGTTTTNAGEEEDDDGLGGGPLNAQLATSPTSPTPSDLMTRLASAPHSPASTLPPLSVPLLLSVMAAAAANTATTTNNTNAYSNAGAAATVGSALTRRNSVDDTAMTTTMTTVSATVAGDGEASSENDVMNNNNNNAGVSGDGGGGRAASSAATVPFSASAPLGDDDAMLDTLMGSSSHDMPRNGLLSPHEGTDTPPPARDSDRGALTSGNSPDDGTGSTTLPMHTEAAATVRDGGSQTDVSAALPVSPLLQATPRGADASSTEQRVETDAVGVAAPVIPVVVVEGRSTDLALPKRAAPIRSALPPPTPPSSPTQVLSGLAATVLKPPAPAAARGEGEEKKDETSFNTRQSSPDPQPPASHFTTELHFAENNYSPYSPKQAEKNNISLLNLAAGTSTTTPLLPPPFTEDVPSTSVTTTAAATAAVGTVAMGSCRELNSNDPERTTNSTSVERQTKNTAAPSTFTVEPPAAISTRHELSPSPLAPPPPLSPLSEQQKQQQRYQIPRASLSFPASASSVPTLSPPPPPGRSHSTQRRPSVGQVVCRWCGEPYTSAVVCPVADRLHHVLREERKKEKKVKRQAQVLLCEGRVAEAVSLLKDAGLYVP